MLHSALKLCLFDATSMRDPLVDICKRYPNQSGDETKAFIFLDTQSSRDLFRKENLAQSIPPTQGLALPVVYQLQLTPTGADQQSSRYPFRKKNVRDHPGHKKQTVMTPFSFSDRGQWCSVASRTRLMSLSKSMIVRHWIHVDRWISHSLIKL